ncbi:MAG: glycosyltransferase family 1 protein [Patescibacteria group bacterium]
MKIVIDRQSAGGKKTGYGFYLTNLLAELEKIKGDNEFIYIDKIQQNLNTPKRIWWDQLGLAREAKKRKADLLFVPSFSCPIFYQGKKVVTAHDLIGKLFPENFSWSAKIYWDKILPYSFTRADHVIVPSENTKKDLMKLLNIPEENISVIYEGAGPHFHKTDKQEAIEKIKNKFNINNKFILAVSTIEPRKNYKRLVEAFKKIDTDADLVIVGKKAWGEELEFGEKIKHIDYVETEDLVSLYNACDLFTMVSLYEGFGLPALEAMTCGAPVLVSNTSSLPEVVDRAGELTDPKSVNEISAKMKMILEDENLRKEMSEKSLEQAKKFSWAKAAQETLKVFEDVGKN